MAGNRPYQMIRPSALEIDNYNGPGSGPQSGVFVPVPAMDQPPLAIDIREQGPSGWQGVQIEIAVDITAEQIKKPELNDGIYYVFTKTATTPLVGLSHVGDFQFDMVRGCPSIIGVGLSVQEVCPLYNPWLQLLSRNLRQCEVRLRIS